MFKLFSVIVGLTVLDGSEASALTWEDCTVRLGSIISETNEGNGPIIELLALSSDAIDDSDTSPEMVAKLQEQTEALDESLAPLFETLADYCESLRK